MDVKAMIEKMSLEEKASYLSGRDFWHTDEVLDAGVSSFMMCDGPNGLRKQIGKEDHLGINESIKTVCYPTSSAVAASFDIELAHELGEHLGDECVRENVAMLLGPGLNMKRSPLGGRNFEYYSEDPYLAGEIASAYVDGLQSRNVCACPKHFAANNQETRRMSGSSNVDERTLHEIYLSAFEAVVKNSRPHSMMCAYNQINGTFCSENKELLTDILRDQWGFEGFVVTDWGAGKDAAKGVTAGLDLVMPGGNDAHKKAILQAVDEGRLTEKEIDRAVERILTAFLWTTERNVKAENVPVSEIEKKDYEFAVKLAENSAVLLKNEDHILPVKKERVAYIGAFAKTPRYQGSGSSHINSKKVSNALDVTAEKGIEVTYAQGYDLKDASKDSQLMKEAVEVAKGADTVVVFAGLPDSFESEGFDRKNIDMPQNQNRLIEEVAKVNEDVVVVLHNGAPVAMPWLDRVKAVLEMYLAGDGVGDATVRILYGETNPSGKLAETFPACMEHTPAYLNFPGEKGNPEYREGVFIGYRYYDSTKTEVLFPFGHGLSYTAFEYSDLKVSKNKMTDKENAKVTVTVKNIGEEAGSEVVQLYVHDVKSSAIRPYKELKGFQKVFLRPGESTTVTFTVSKRSFAYYETAIHDFYVESGKFEFLVGSSSADIRLKAEIKVEGTKEIPCHFDSNSTIGDILATSKGKEVLAPMMQQMMGEQSAEGLEALGEGAQEMAAAMAMEMPLSALVGMSGVPGEIVQQILEQLNQK